MQTTAIKIANPVRGGQLYTSPRRATHLVKSGRAAITDDGQLFFYKAETVIRRREEIRLSDALARYRSGVVFWNGSGDPLAKHRPGEARS